MKPRVVLLLLVLSGCARPKPHFTGQGIDVSRHNGEIDWSAVARDGIAFAFVKATEGGDLVDARYAQNVSGARAAGLRVGAYHFFTFCRPGVDQAKSFLRTVKFEALTLPPVVDVEFVGNCKQPPPADQLRRELDEFISLVEAQSKKELIIYTTPDADAALLVGLVRERWIRSIGREPANGWTVWQYDAAGKVAGIEGDVDLNYWKAP